MELGIFISGHASKHDFVSISLYTLVQEAGKIHDPSSKYLSGSVQDTQSLAVLPWHTAQSEAQIAQVPELS